MKSPFKQMQFVVREDVDNCEVTCDSNVLQSDLVDCNICVEESIDTSSTTSESPIFEFSTILPPILGEYDNNDANYSAIERHPGYVLPPLSMVIKQRLTDIADRSNNVISTCPKELFRLRDPTALCTISSANSKPECNILPSSEEQIGISSIPTVSSPSSVTVNANNTVIPSNLVENLSSVDSYISVEDALGNASNFLVNMPTTHSVISQYNSADDYVQAIKCVILEEEIRTQSDYLASQSLIEILLPKEDVRIDSEVTNVFKMRDKVLPKEPSKIVNVNGSDMKTLPLLQIDNEVANKDLHNLVVVETNIGCSKDKYIDVPETLKEFELVSDDFMTLFNSKSGILILQSEQNRTDDKDVLLDTESPKDLDVLIESDLKTSSVACRKTNSDEHDANYSDELLNHRNGSKSEPSLENKGNELLVYSPLLFSDNEDSENYPCYNNILMAPKFGQQQEQCRLKQIQESLIGVIPPPSVTIPQLGVDEMLRLLRENADLMSLAVTAERIDLERSSALRQAAMECHWPGVKTCCYPDVHYNNGPFSEEFEALCQKFTQRFVGCETASTCNLWTTSAGDRRNCKRAVGPSPGRRLSHLARRRRAFSRDSLLGSLPTRTSVAERRQILVQNKKPGNAQEQTCKFPTKALSHKRALFQSPDASMKKCPAPKSGSSSKRKSRIVKPTGAGLPFKRALFSSGCKDEGSKRRLVYPSDQPSTSERPCSATSGNTNTLSSGHKKKLLWAVAEALRCSGIGMKHELFRPCASALARVCRCQLAPLLETRSGSTTEIMVKLANLHAANIVKEMLAAVK